MDENAAWAGLTNLKNTLANLRQDLKALTDAVKVSSHTQIAWQKSYVCATWTIAGFTVVMATHAIIQIYQLFQSTP